MASACSLFPDSQHQAGAICSLLHAARRQRHSPPPARSARLSQRAGGRDRTSGRSVSGLQFMSLSSCSLPSQLHSQRAGGLERLGLLRSLFGVLQLHRSLTGGVELVGGASSTSLSPSSGSQVSQFSLNYSSAGRVVRAAMAAVVQWEPDSFILFSTVSDLLPLHYMGPSVAVFKQWEVSSDYTGPFAAVSK